MFNFLYYFSIYINLYQYWYLFISSFFFWNWIFLSAFEEGISFSLELDTFFNVALNIYGLFFCSIWWLSTLCFHFGSPQNMFSFPYELLFATSSPTESAVWFSTHSVSSVAQSCPTLCNLMNCSTPGLPVHHQLLYITIKLTSIESVMPPSHLFLWCHLFLLPPIPPSIRVFSSESTLHMRWPKN